MNHYSNETLIVTSAINSRDPYLKIKNAQDRLLQTYCSLISWITKTHVNNIVLCDNTGVDHTFSQISLLAKQYGKKFERLVFEGDYEKVITLGKGYGEGEIMKHVFSHSLLLGESETFYKITGRVFVDNYNDISVAEQNRHVVFNFPLKWWKKIIWFMIANSGVLSSFISRKGTVNMQTVFYKSSKKYYKDHLIDLYLEVDDKRNMFLENLYFMPLFKYGFTKFSLSPSLIGYCAGTGTLYGLHNFSQDVIEHARQLLADG